MTLCLRQEKQLVDYFVLLTQESKIDYNKDDILALSTRQAQRLGLSRRLLESED